MSSKASGSGTVKKTIQVGIAIAGPVLAGLSWFARLALKLHGKGKARKTIVKKQEEKSGMIGTDMIKIVLKVLGGAVILAGGTGIVYTLIQKVKNWLTGRTKPAPGPQIPPKTQPVSKPVPPVSYQVLFAQKGELEQEMARVTGGDTGLVALREMIRDAASEGWPDSQYREAYRVKQDRLRGYMKDYQALLKQAEGASEEEKVRFTPNECLAQYQELLDERF